MNTSSDTPGPGGEPFDVEAFARETVRSVEFGDAVLDVLEDRVARLEECIAASWYRRWRLWRRLRREMRASVATWPEEYIPRRDWLGRRGEWADFTASERYDRRAWKPQFGSAGHAGQDGPGEGGADPGAGYLP